MIKRILHLIRSDDGPTAIEYAVMLSLIAGVTIATVGTLANAMKNSFNSSGNAIVPALSS